MEKQERAKSQYGAYETILVPCSFGVVTEPRVEKIYFSDEERQEVMREELLWILAHRV